MPGRFLHPRDWAVDRSGSVCKRLLPLQKENDMADKQSVPSNSYSSMLGSNEHGVAQPCKDELEPGYIEERFRVDRKKLEQMLQGCGF